MKPPARSFAGHTSGFNRADSSLVSSPIFHQSSTLNPPNTATKLLTSAEMAVLESLEDVAAGYSKIAIGMGFDIVCLQDTIPTVYMMVWDQNLNFSLLRKCWRQHHISAGDLPETDDEGNFTIETLAILIARSVARKGTNVPQIPAQAVDSGSADAYWVDENCLNLKLSFQYYGSRSVRCWSEEVPQIMLRWLNADSEIATWEYLKYILRTFSSFDPWGQGSFERGGIVMNIQGFGKKKIRGKKKNEGVGLLSFTDSGIGKEKEEIGAEAGMGCG